MPTLPANCQNGGYYDGIKCVCTDDTYYGVFCENIIDRTPPVTTVDAAVAVVMKITSEQFTEDLQDFESETFKAFEEKFTQQIEEAYAEIPGYKGIKIIGIRQGSVIVDYEVIVELEYKEHANINEQYEEMFKQVEEKITELVTTLSNCTDGTVFCFDENVTTGRVEIPSPCSKIATEFQDYYMELLIPEGMTCVSQCDPINPKSQNCNEGRCVIQKSVGPQCLQITPIQCAALQEVTTVERRMEHGRGVQGQISTYIHLLNAQEKYSNQDYMEVLELPSGSYSLLSSQYPFS
ncbi:mucin-17-like [Hyperolius riggenbachi]|uniref:mucin-17-like n=1 Tax=Hyperolius riggenbachi TaxID=752182 RepID=UPI0035A2B7B1